MIILSIIFLIIAALIALIFKFEITQYLILIGSTIVAVSIIAGLSYFIGTRQDYYNEVWNYKATAVRHYQYWDEEVPCCHPRYETEYRLVQDSNGKGYHEESYQVQVGWMHPYDVDEHPDHWEALTDYGDEKEIDESAYEKWHQTWMNEHFVNMHHVNVHSIDGNMFESNFNGNNELIYPLEEIKTYENKIRVSNSIFNYPKPSKELQKKYKRPADQEITDAVLSYDGTQFSNYENYQIRRVNALLGPTFKIHVIILLWNDQTSSAIMENVLSAWNGPNKNELVIAIGINLQRKINWCQCYSWCDDTTIHAKVRQDILATNQLNFNEIEKSLKTEIPLYWKKKNFHDFDYIHNPLPIWTYFLASILDITAFIAIIFVIKSIEIN